jgi:hypothetical protein
VIESAQVFPPKVVQPVEAAGAGQGANPDGTAEGVGTIHPLPAKPGVAYRRKCPVHCLRLAGRQKGAFLCSQPIAMPTFRDFRTENSANDRRKTTHLVSN